MLIGDTTYNRLPRVRKAFTTQHLWQGPDHLLTVRNSVFHESHRRFYFKDIQAITVQATDTGKYFNLLLGFIIALFGILLFFPALVTGGWPAVFLGFLIACIFVPSVVLLIINLVLGPTCSCQIHTAVQLETMRGLSRIRVARKFVAQTLPLIEQSQGRITAESLAANEDKLDTYRARQKAAVPFRSKDRPEVRHENAYVHTALFFLLLVSGIVLLISIFARADFNDIAEAILYLVVLGTNIVALVRQSGTDLPQIIRATTWSSLVLTLIYVVLTLIVEIVITLSAAPGGLAEDSLLDNEVFFALLLISAFVALFLGTLGLHATARFRSAYQQALALAQTQADVQADMQAFDDAPKGP